MGVEVTEAPIEARWAEWNRAGGAFGPAVAAAEDAPGGHGRRQRFQRGEIATSTDAGIVVSAFLLWDQAYVEWSIPPDGSDTFRVDVSVRLAGQDEWQSQGFDQAAVTIHGQPQISMRLQGFGDYQFRVRADNDDSPFTAPVTVQLAPYVETPDPGNHIDVTGVFGERWHALAAWDGPLGLPVTAPGPTGQRFEHGAMATAPASGVGMVVTAYQRHNSVEVSWGGGDTAWEAFQVDAWLDGALVARRNVTRRFADPFEWARPFVGSGSVVFEDLAVGGEGEFSFYVYPGIEPNVFPPGVSPAGFAGSLPPVTVFVTMVRGDARLPYPPLDATPGQAFASHRPRADAVARHYASRRPLGLRLPQPDNDNPEATENVALQLMAHLHAIALDSGFRSPREMPSRFLVPLRLRQRRAGKVGTHKDYDMALKGLMVAIYRYRGQLADSDIEYVLQDLVPDDLQGPHDPSVEAVSVLQLPETENHLLMIESTRYLVNQLLYDRTRDPRFLNSANGLASWLLGFMQNIAEHDFLEFNARPYARLSTHALLNLYEFARDEPIRTGAQVLLDYTMAKFAVSSCRGRRIAPFRRLQERLNHPGTEFNDVMAPRGDQIAQFFAVYTGWIDNNSRPLALYYDGWTDDGVIAGTSTYRPPAAAYILARDTSWAGQHVFFHGDRRPLKHGDPHPQGGIEVYYRSPSFLLSSGGQFLNSGYGSDEGDIGLIGLKQYAQTARAQATTLLPTGADPWFADVIRFDPYPDSFEPPDVNDAEPIRGVSVNLGVNNGVACGANLRVPQLWLTQFDATWDGPWLFVNLDQQPTAMVKRLGFYLACYATPPENSPDGGPESLGVLSVVESSTMPFAEFVQYTKERNAGLPTRLGLHKSYIFTTADGHRFSFWLHQTDHPTSPRLIDLDHRIDDFATLPLVSGPWLNARGHDGHIELGYPGAVTPLVLDFTDPSSPTRTPDDVAYAGPLVDRARAIMSYALDLVSKARGLTPSADPAWPIDPADAYATAVAVFWAMNAPDSVLAEYLWLWGQIAHIQAQAFIEAGRPLDAAAAAREGAAREQAASFAPDAANRWQDIATELTALAGILSWAGALTEGVQSQQAAVELIKRLAPEQGLAAGDATYNLIYRLFDAERQGEVPGVLPALLEAYRSYATDATSERVAVDLENLSKRLLVAGFKSAAVDVARGAVEVLADGVHSLALARSRQDLIARLIDNGQPVEAATLVTATLDGYRGESAASDVRVDLAELVRILTEGGLTAEAAETQRLLDSIS